MFLTCAFNESLDIYSLPENGVIPKNWSIEKLKEANQTSRSYEDRILTSMSLGYRNSKYRSKYHYEKLFSDFYMVRQLKVANFYLNKLKRLSKSDDESKHYSIASSLIDAEIAYTKENPQLLRRDFIKGIKNKISTLGSAKNSTKNERWASIASGCFSYMINERNKASKILEADKAKYSKSPFSQFVRVNYLEKIYSKKKHRNKLLNLYKELSTNVNLDEAAKVYYSYNLVKTLDSFSKTEDCLLAIRY